MYFFNLSKFVFACFVLTCFLAGCNHQAKENINPSGSDILPEKGNPRKASGSGHRIGILQYHNVVTEFPSSIYDRKKSDFENDLKYLQNRGFEIITFEDLLKLKSGHKQLNSDAIIISFDDGFASCFTKIYPVLKKYNMPATFFIVPEWIGTPNYMPSWSQVWLMHDYLNLQNDTLFAIHSHTASHPFLKQWGVGKDPAVWQHFLDLQLGDARNWIVDVTHQKTLFLALPYGDGAYDSTIINTAKAQGYDGIRTSVRGTFTVDDLDTNMYSLPSLPVQSTSIINFIENYF